MFVLYVVTHGVPRSKFSPTWLHKTKLSMLYKAKDYVYFEIRIEQKNTLREHHEEFFNIKLLVFTRGC